VSEPATSSGKLLVEVKNISKAELNISPDELMERFTRGDSSRNTEGSGLGLAIAKDLTTLMGGVFEISIDGDMFKASVMLDRA
jgi:signal transduction histidine kinase